MDKRMGWRLLGAAALTAAMAQPAQAALIVTDSVFDPATTVFNQNGAGVSDQVVGYTFTVGANDLRVTALGEWDVSAARGTGTGLPSSLLVGLWDNGTGGLLASTFVPTGTAGTHLIDDFRFVDLAAAVVLQRGRSYTLGDRRFPFGGIQSHFQLQGVRQHADRQRRCGLRAERQHVRSLRHQRDAVCQPAPDAGHRRRGLPLAGPEHRVHGRGRGCRGTVIDGAGAAQPRAAGRHAAGRQPRAILNTATLARRLGQRRTARPAWKPKLSSTCRPLRSASTSKSAKVPTRMLGVSYHW